MKRHPKAVLRKGMSVEALSPLHAALREEILNDPEGLGYAKHLDSGSDSAVAEILNQRIYRGPVPIIDLSAYCTINGISGAIEAMSWDASAPQQARAVCFSAMSILRDDMRLNTADTDDPAFDQMTDGIISLGLMTTEHKTALHSLGDNRLTRAEQLLGFGVSVTQADISLALRGY